MSKRPRKIHIFDCDGVLVDSNAAKIEALRNTLRFLGCPVGFVDWAVDEFRRNFGRTRADHFNVFTQYEGIGEYRLNSVCVDSAIKHYGDQVGSLYFNCPVIGETLAYILQHIRDNNIYVVSASNQDELRRILPIKIPQISIDRILGGPVKKAENLKTVVAATGSKNIVFYGDAVQDAKAAIDVGVTFFGLTKYSSDPEALKLFCSDKRLPCYETCSDIL